MAQKGRSMARLALSRVDNTDQTTSATKTLAHNEVAVSEGLKKRSIFRRVLHPIAASRLEGENRLFV